MDSHFTRASGFKDRAVFRSTCTYSSVALPMRSAYGAVRPKGPSLINIFNDLFHFPSANEFSKGRMQKVFNYKMPKLSSALFVFHQVSLLTGDYLCWQSPIQRICILARHAKPPIGRSSWSSSGSLPALSSLRCFLSLSQKHVANISWLGIVSLSFTMH